MEQSNIDVSEFSIPLFVVSLIVITIYWRKLKTIKSDFEIYGGMPKIPFALPILGNLPQLGTRPYVSLMNLTNTYGQIFRAEFGAQNVVVLNSTDLIREAIIGQCEEFAGRPFLFMTHESLKGKGLISSPYNKDFKEHRRFVLSSFNRYGKRQNKLESSCVDSIKEVLSEIREDADQSCLTKSTVFKNKISQVASKNILKMTFGEKNFDKNVFSQLMDLLAANFQNTSVAAAYNFIPITRMFQKSILRNATKCGEFLNELIDQHAENYNFGQDNNIVDAYLNEMHYQAAHNQKENINKPLRYTTFSFDHLNSIVQDLFVAGTETIANTLNWAIFYATFFPELQEKCFKEIEKNIGKERTPSQNDRRNMHYIEAFMNETIRYHCAGPILIPRETTVDTKLAGYKIPSNTFIILNIWSCMRDEKYWNEPNEFNPDRFITPDGKFECNNPAMIPFSAGARACPGEALARSELFLIFTSILQKFSFEFESDEIRNNPNLLDGIPGITLSPPNVSFKIKSR